MIPLFWWIVLSHFFSSKDCWPRIWWFLTLVSHVQSVMTWLTDLCCSNAICFSRSAVSGEREMFTLILLINVFSGRLAASFHVYIIHTFCVNIICSSTFQRYIYTPGNALLLRRQHMPAVTSRDQLLFWDATMTGRCYKPVLRIERAWTFYRPPLWQLGPK